MSVEDFFKNVKPGNTGKNTIADFVSSISGPTLNKVNSMMAMMSPRGVAQMILTAVTELDHKVRSDDEFEVIIDAVRQSMTEDIEEHLIASGVAPEDIPPEVIEKFRASQPVQNELFELTEKFAREFREISRRLDL